MSSEEISISRLTNPSAQMAFGMRRRVVAEGCIGFDKEVVGEGKAALYYFTAKHALQIGNVKKPLGYLLIGRCFKLTLISTGFAVRLLHIQQ